MPSLFPDLIDPIDGAIGRLVHGPMHRFAFDARSDYTGMEVEKLLRQYGIRIWGRELDNVNEMAFLVKRSQAVWAEYLLCRAGIPLTTPLLDQRNAQWAKQHGPDKMPEPWRTDGIGPSSFVDHVVDWIDRLLG